MRHRRRGRQLGRTSPHRKAMLRNMASSLFLTERSEIANEIHGNTPRVRRRIVTTIQKAKEVRSIVEKCITLARKVQPCYDQAAALMPEKLRDAETDRQSTAYKDWRNSDQWQEWAAARAPIVNAQRKALQMLGSREAVDILFNDIAPALIEEAPDRVSGFTRILKIAKPRLGDNGTQAILEILGESNNRDTSTSAAPQAPVLEVEDDEVEDSVTDEEATDEVAEESEEVSSADADSDDSEEAAEETEEQDVAEASDDAEEAEAAAEATEETEAAEEAAGDSDADDQQEEEEA